MKQPTDRELVDFVRRVAAKYLSLPNLTSIGVGRKVVGGVETNELAVQFTTEAKFSPEELTARGLTPLPKKLQLDDGRWVPTDVVARRFRRGHRITTSKRPTSRRSLEALANHDRQVRHEPLLGGISVSVASGTAGTLGLIVRDRRTGRPLILSNWHVLHGTDGRLDDAVVQPGAWDGGVGSNAVVGRLLRSHLGVEGDCAVATVESREFTAGLLGFDIVPRKLGQVEIGDRVVKSGRTTGITHGRVVRVGVITRLDYGGDAGIRAVGGFEIGLDPDHRAPDGELSSGGDSGSCWMIADGAGATDIVAGLHFAGEVSDVEEHALACNIDEVMGVLDIELYAGTTEGGEPGDDGALPAFPDSPDAGSEPTIDADQGAVGADADEEPSEGQIADLSIELLQFLAAYLHRQDARTEHVARSRAVPRSRA